MMASPGLLQPGLWPSASCSLVAGPVQRVVLLADVVLAAAERVVAAAGVERAVAAAGVERAVAVAAEHAVAAVGVERAAVAEYAAA